MVSEKMVAWGSQGCVIRDLAAYGGSAPSSARKTCSTLPSATLSVPAPSCVRQTIEHLLQTVPAEQLHAYTAAGPCVRPREDGGVSRKTFGVGYRAEDDVYDLRRILGAGDAGLCAALAGR